MHLRHPPIHRPVPRRQDAQRCPPAAHLLLERGPPLQIPFQIDDTLAQLPHLPLQRHRLARVRRAQRLLELRLHEPALDVRALQFRVHARQLDRLAVGAQELRAVDRVQQLAQRGMRRQHRLARQDRHAAEARYLPHAPRIERLRDEVLSRGQHAVCGGAFELRVLQVVVQTRAQLRASRLHAPPCVWLAVGLGDPLWVVVEVAPAIGPADVVQQHHRGLPAVLRRPLLERAQLVDDRVPVVVAVNQRQIHVRDLLQHVEALAAVKVQPLAVLRPQAIDVQRRVGVDRVHHRAVCLRPAQQRAAHRADLHADLHDRARAERVEEGVYQQLQIPVHGGPRRECTGAGRTKCGHSGALHHMFTR